MKIKHMLFAGVAAIVSAMGLSAAKGISFDSILNVQQVQTVESSEFQQKIQKIKSDKIKLVLELEEATTKLQSAKHKTYTMARQLEVANQLLKNVDKSIKRNDVFQCKEDIKAIEVCIDQFYRNYDDS